MVATKQQIHTVLKELNPWFSASPLSTARSFCHQRDRVLSWMNEPSVPPPLLIKGVRHAGKTTLLHEVAQCHIDGARDGKVLYIGMDHPLLKMAGIDGAVRAWEETYAHRDWRPELILIDEVQNAPDWQPWVRSQKHRRIVMACSAMTDRLQEECNAEQWQSVTVATMSFHEYLTSRGVPLDRMQGIRSFRHLFSWSDDERHRAIADAQMIVPHFSDYLAIGGFPATIGLPSVRLSQQEIRESILHSILKQDTAAVYGLRNVLDLEKVFAYLCLHDGSVADVKNIAKRVGIPRQSVSSFLDILEKLHLCFRVQQFAHDSQGRSKFYLADAAIRGSVLLLGDAIREDSISLAMAAESAVLKHIASHAEITKMSYWRDSRTNSEVAMIAETAKSLLPFDFDYSGTTNDSHRRGIRKFCAQHRQAIRAYSITRDIADFGISHGEHGLQILTLPAALACFWLSKSKIE